MQSSLVLGWIFLILF